MLHFQRVTSFEGLYTARDPGYAAPEGDTYALRLREEFEELLDTPDDLGDLDGQEGYDHEEGAVGPASKEIMELCFKKSLDAVKKTDWRLGTGASGRKQAWHLL